MLALVIAPSFASAISGDVDPQGDSSCISIVNNLRYKTNDAKTDGEVSVLQDFLQAGGYLNSNPVGYFGLMTTAAVKKFQSANNISATGYVGPITREKIKAQSCAGQTTVNAGDTTGHGQSTVGLITSTTTSNISTLVPTADFTRNLSLGSTGPDVTSLQIFLSVRGFMTMPTGTSVGNFDQATKNALAAYQTSAGISANDGSFGPATRASVNAAKLTAVVATPSTTPASLEQLRKSFDLAIANGGNAVSSVPGCSVGLVYSPTTGQACFNTNLPTNSITAVSNSGYTLTSHLDGRSTAFDIVTFTASFDSNKMDPAKMEIQLQCPQGVSSSMDEHYPNACSNVVPMTAAGGVINSVGTYKVTLNLTNTSMESKPVKAILLVNNLDRDMAYNTFVLQSTAMLALPAGSGSTTITRSWPFGSSTTGGLTTPVVPTPPPTPPTTVVTTPVVPTTPTVNTTCPQSLTINGTTYSISPCSINMTMIDGQGDKSFSTTITAVGASPSFGYSTRGYGVGFPDYGILGGGSGGANGATTLNLQFKDSVLSADGKSPKTYSGYLPIHIFQGSETGFDNNFLNLNVSATVNPAN